MIQEPIFRLIVPQADALLGPRVRQDQRVESKRHPHGRHFPPNILR